MLTFNDILTALKANRQQTLEGKIKINNTSITGVKTIGFNKEVWIIPFDKSSHIKIQSEDVINVD